MYYQQVLVPTFSVAEHSLHTQRGAGRVQNLDVALTARAIAGGLSLPAPRPWLLFARDALSFAVFVASFFGRTVFWRDQLFHVEASGCMTVDGDKAL